MATVAERLAEAVRHHEAGHLAEAEALYRAILAEAPRQAHALHLLGVLAQQTGRHAEALDLISRALAAHGPHPVFHSNLAAVYLALGRLTEAAGHAREAIRLQPNFADAHANLGVALRRLGRLDEAEAALREALRLNPRHVDARSNLGAVLHRQGRLPEALSCLRETVRLAPKHAQARNDLGGVLAACGMPNEAVQQLREAVRLKPDFAQAHNNLGMALRGLGRVAEAMSCFREALRLDPTYVQARHNLGYALEIQGKIGAALDEFQEALRLDPNHAGALASLSKLASTGHYQLSEEEDERIRQLVERRDLPLLDRSRLHFALAWVLDKAGAYPEAFEQYQRGNELRREFDHRGGITFDFAAERRLVDRLIATCTPAYFERVRSFGVDSELPVFVVGMLRSGTSLAEQILASHPQVHGAGELRELNTLAGTLPQRLPGAGDYPECLARLDAATGHALAEEYLHTLRAVGGAALRVVDKMPFNFQHLGLIATLFPRARVVHCRRDPVDTCLSCYFQNFADPMPFALDLRHLGAYYREYERLMAHWAAVLPVPVFELRYEELTADQEAVTRRLLAFCGLDWDQRCLHFQDTERIVRTASALQVRQPMYRTSVGRWKHYEAQIEPLLQALRQETAE